MSNPISEQKSDMNAPIQNLSMGETEHSQTISSEKTLLSPLIVDAMNPNDICDLGEHEYNGVTNITPAYSPFITNFFMGTADMNKTFRSSYGGIKNESTFLSEK